jgi:DNA-binding MarR family transcriptional regulator
LFAGDDDPIAELPLAQLRVCGILYHGRRSMSALSKELGVSLSAMTQIADRLERSSLVQRVGQESDRRVRSLQLTDRGENILRHREQTRTRRACAALSQLSPDVQEDIVAAIHTFAAACAALVGPEAGAETKSEPTGQRSA